MSGTTLDVNSLVFEELALYQPSLAEIQAVLTNGLRKNFEHVNVSVVECPDLTEEPFKLAAKGLGGSPTLLEIGGPPFLLPLVNRSKVYDLKAISEKVFANEQGSEILAIGAGAGPFPHAKRNCEGIYNLKINSDGTVTNASHFAVVNALKDCELHKIPNEETRLALLGNIFLCKGDGGLVLRVDCKKRIGPLDYIASIRCTLADYYKEKTVGLGGAFILKNGKAKQHVMQDFSITPLNNDDDLNKWLRFYDMPAPLVAVGTLITNETDLDLRVQHFHSCNRTDNLGGHYHIDVTEDVVEYEGYFNVGRKIVRVDKPLDTHKFGRD